MKRSSTSKQKSHKSLVPGHPASHDVSVNGVRRWDGIRSHTSFFFLDRASWGERFTIYDKLLSESQGPAFFFSCNCLYGEIYPLRKLLDAYVRGIGRGPEENATWIYRHLDV